MPVGINLPSQIDHGLVTQPPDATLRRFLLHAFSYIRPQRHELHGEGPADKLGAGMQDLPVPGELVQKSL
jgi:hypothetical protein